MINRELHPGMRVETGDVGTEDFDAGIILGARVGTCSGYTWWRVQWDNGVSTECLATQLRGEFSTCFVDGCNHSDCAQAAEDEVKRWAAEEREYDRCEDEGLDAWRGV